MLVNSKVKPDTTDEGILIGTSESDANSFLSNLLNFCRAPSTTISDLGERIDVMEMTAFEKWRINDAENLKSCS